MRNIKDYKNRYIKIILSISIFLIIDVFYLKANDFDLKKINEFAFAQNFNSGGTLDLDYPYIYGITSHGLEIYELNDNNLPEKISCVPIKHAWNTVKKKGNYIYINQMRDIRYSDGKYEFYQVDISNVYKPIICDSLIFTNNLSPVWLNFFEDYLYFGLSTGMGTVESRFYSLPDLELVSTVGPNILFHKVNDSLAIDYTATPNVANIYDLSDINSIQYLTQRDFGVLAPDYFQSINDTIVMATNQEKVMIWDISDKANWELISDYDTQYILNYGNNFIRFYDYALLIGGSYLEIIDISNIYSIQTVDTACVYDDSWSAVYYDNYLYVGTGEEGIQRYSFNNNSLDYVDNYFEFPSFSKSYLHDDYLFVQTFNYGVYLFDISNPLEPVLVPTILGDMHCKNLHGHKNIIWVQDYSDYSYRIYDITDPLNPQLQNVIPIGDWQQISRSCILFDGGNLNKIYIFYTSPTKLEKYDISEVNNAELLFEYTDIEADAFAVKDGYGYLTNKVNSVQELYVLDGLNENNPFITEYYPGFLQGNREGYLQLCENYLCTRNEPTRFYSLTQPLNPDFEFELEYPSLGSFWYSDSIVFAPDFSYAMVYNISNSSNQIAYTSDIIDLYTFLAGANVFQENTKNYLFAVEYSAIEVFEFSYNSVNNNSPADNIFITTHPNPFSTSTTISLNSKKPINKNTKIEIYNIKGQKVRSLALTENEISENANLSYSVSWDGKNKNNKKVASGIYFCKIKTSENTFVSKILRVE
ncbi:MAG: T9SS type A sorting domain-containing protein [Candidatus Cloacimonetes bacterium]|nr:T9SS type A sorting domain-containing protein [Candidatus Cloacimonadota bacterium]